MKKLQTNSHGNIDCRQGSPAGYALVYGMHASDSAGSDRRADFWIWVERERVEHYDALVGFSQIGAQSFSQAHFTKPAHWRPVIEVLVPEVAAARWHSFQE